MERIAWRSVILASLLAAGHAHAGSCDLARAPEVPVIKGLPYQQARTAILAKAWRPVRGTPHNDFSSNEQAFRERGDTELQYCRSSDDSLCRFEFISADNYLLWITTSGEENAALGTAASVTAARVTCSGDPDPG